jgi:hypothetical protein
LTTTAEIFSPYDDHFGAMAGDCHQSVAELSRQTAKDAGVVIRKFSCVSHVKFLFAPCEGRRGYP